jgi:hypothetical protein
MPGKEKAAPPRRILFFVGTARVAVGVLDRLSRLSSVQRLAVEAK